MSFAKKWFRKQSLHDCYRQKSWIGFPWNTRILRSQKRHYRQTLRARRDALTALWILVREEGGSKLFDFSYHICRKIPLLWKFYNNGVSTFGQFWWCEITPSMEFVMQCEYCWVLLESVCISFFAIIEFLCVRGTQIINSVTIAVDNDWPVHEICSYIV